MKNSTQPRPREAVCAFIPAPLKRELEQCARSTDRSVSAVVRIAIARHLSATHEGAKQ